MAITYSSVKPAKNFGTFLPMMPMTIEKMMASTTYRMIAFGKMPVTHGSRPAKSL